ncbi:Apx/Shrm Domain 2 [Trinorchestia longiramus]|nr:Apx/Shrm Domain 2 [Trinorchestia longiramus]
MAPVLRVGPRVKAPGPELKTTADYMEGVFRYEVRRDILATRSQHLIPQYESQDKPENPLHLASRQQNPNLSSTSNGEVTNDFRSKESGASLSRLNPISSESNPNFSSLSNRFSKVSLSPLSQESVSSLTNNNNYANLNSSLARSPSSQYTPTNSPAHLSAANQVANFTSLNSSVRPHDSKLSYSFGRSLSSPEQNANLSLSSNDVSGHSSPGGGCSSEESKPQINPRSPLPSDSAYFTSESKARLLTRMRSTTEEREIDATRTQNSPTSPTSTDSQALMQKKEELMRSIGRKLDILRAEEEAIKEEIRLNNELGHEVTQRVEMQAKPQEFEKFKLHVNEIDKITSLLLGLSGRLARAENALLLLSQHDGPELRRVLELKRDRLSEQLQEAMLLKENIDRRAAQVDKSLLQYLNEAEFADYDHFSKMKAKLVMDAREISDKIKLGEEQTTALRDTFKSSEEASLSNG